jgi:hypothetical protein
MGYETTLIFVTGGVNGFKGYCSIEATLRMGKIAYEGEISMLIEELRKCDTETDYTKDKARTEQYRRIFTYGEWSAEMQELTEGERDKEYDKYWKLRVQLEEKFPYVYYNEGENEQFTDNYGDFLMLTDLETLLSALIKDRAKHITEHDTHHGYGYRRYELAIRLTEAFMNEKIWGKEQVKVILFGH